jgi:predicted ATPase
MAAKGWAAPEVGRANARARELCQRLGDTPRLFPVLYGEWVFHVVRAELGEGRQAGKELLHLAQRQGNRSAETVGSRILGKSSFLCGEMALARAQLERALALYDPVADRALAYLFAQDPRVAGLSVLSLALFALGSPEQAQARSADALAEARELAHRNTLGYALLYSCILSQLRRDLNEAHQRADMLISLATEQGSPHFLAAGAILRGWTFTAEEPQLGIEQIRDGLAAWQSTGANFLVPFFLSLLAELQTGVARPRQGLDLLTDALRRAGATGGGWFTPELHRLAAELMMQSPETRAAADAHLHQAITIARQQGAKLWELRATTSLAELLMTQGRHDEAQTLLAPICADFTDQSGIMPDLHAAEQALRQAAQCA